MKTTEAQISKLVAEAAKLAGLSNNKKSAIESGHDKYLSYENAPVYGGYRLIMVVVSNGAHYGAFNTSSTCPRQKPAVFALMLECLIYGIEYEQRQEAKKIEEKSVFEVWREETGFLSKGEWVYETVNKAEYDSFEGSKRTFLLIENK